MCNLRTGAEPLKLFIKKYSYKYISIDRRYFYWVFTTHMTSICMKKVNKYFCRISSFYRSSHRKCSAKKVFLKILKYSQEIPVLESLCEPSRLQFYQKETPTLMFSCEYCKTFKNTYSEEHLRTTAYFMKKNRHSWRLTPWLNISIGVSFW